MSSALGKSDGIIIRIMNVSDYQKVKQAMGGNVCKDEPLDICCGGNVKKCNEQEDDAYYISMVEQGTSLVAINEHNGGRIVGLVLSYAQTPSDLNRYSKELLAPTEFERIDQFISKVENEVNLFERYNISKLLCSHITNVEASMRGKGLGTRLAAALMEVGRSKGYPLMVAYCTSFYSARQKKTLGMECVYEKAYADYKDANGQVVFKTPEPHTHLRVMAIKL